MQHCHIKSHHHYSVTGHQTVVFYNDELKFLTFTCACLKAMEPSCMSCGTQGLPVTAVWVRYWRDWQSKAAGFLLYLQSVIHSIYVWHQPPVVPLRQDPQASTLGDTAMTNLAGRGQLCCWRPGPVGTHPAARDKSICASRPILRRYHKWAISGHNRFGNPNAVAYVKGYWQRITSLGPIMLTSIGNVILTKRSAHMFNHQREMPDFYVVWILCILGIKNARLLRISNIYWSLLSATILIIAAFIKYDIIWAIWIQSGMYNQGSFCVYAQQYLR